MDEKSLVEIRVRLNGPDALRLAEEKVEACKASGDNIHYEQAVRQLELTKQILEEDKAEATRRAKVDPAESDLFAGLTNAVLKTSVFEIAAGLRLETIYAHITAPYLVAFAPAERGKPHPPPWKAASGGVQFDIRIQIALDKDSRPANFDRLNTLWWVSALLRLHHSTGIRVPIISNEDWSTAASSPREPIFWPIELDSNGIAFDGYQREFAVPAFTLNWLRKHFIAGATLMEEEEFNLAFCALDSAQRTSSLAAAMLLVWSSLEALIRPGGQRITHRLCLGIATHLEHDPVKRDKVYGAAKALYEARGQITHAAETPKAADVLESFKLARRCFLTAIENRKPPEFQNLEARWRTRT